MENRVNCSIEYFSGAECEVVVVRIPNNELDPRLGYKTRLYSSCEELTAWLRSLGSPAAESQAGM